MLTFLWQACLTAFLEECRSIQTRRAYAGILNAFTKHLDRTALQDASKQDVLSFLHKTGRAHRRNPTGEPSPALWNARLSALSSFYRFASAYTVPGVSGPEALFQRTSPTTGLKLRAAPTMPKGLTPDEVKRFFAAIDQETVIGRRDRAFFLLLLYTCLRREEACRVTWGDIEPTTFANGREGYRMRVTCKGRHGQHEYRELPGEVWYAIIAYLEASDRLEHMQEQDPLFVSCLSSVGLRQATKNRQLASKTFEKQMRCYLFRAKIEGTHTLHSWRHTGAQIRYAGQRDLLACMKALGHRNASTTQRYLARLLGDVEDPGAAVIAVQFGGL